jgi:hypothetical protein
MPGFEVLGNERLDAQIERLGERVTEYVRGRRIPEDYLLGLRIRDNDRIPDPLEELADPQVFRSHVLRPASYSRRSRHGLQ